MESFHGSRLAPDERRDQLIRMGVELLGRRAYDQLSITELARAAGISKGLLYHYFATKSEFVVAVLRQSREELERRISVDPSLDPGARLDAGLDAFVAFVEQHAAGFQALARGRSGEDQAIVDELAEGRRRRIQMLVGLAADLSGMDRAEVDSPALETALAGWLAYSEEILVRWLSERTMSREDVLHLLRQSFLASVEAAAELRTAARA